MISASYTVPYDSDVKSDVCYTTDFERKLSKHCSLAESVHRYIEKKYLYVGPWNFVGPQKLEPKGPNLGS